MRLRNINRTRAAHRLWSYGFSDEINPAAFHRQTIFTRAGYAYMAAAALYLLSGYATAIVPAIALINHTEQTQKHSEVFYIQGIVELTAISVAGVLLYRLLLVALDARFIDPDRTRPARVRRIIGRAGLYSLIVVGAGFLPLNMIAALLPTDSDYPLMDRSSVMSVVHGFLHGASAGFTEELFLVALPVLLLRAARRPWWEIIVLLTLVRFSFHLYYGLPTVGYLPWAVAAILLYRYTHSIAPSVIGHGAVNVIVHAGEFLSSVTFWARPTLAAFILIMVICELGTTPRQPVRLQRNRHSTTTHRSRDLPASNTIQ